MKRIPDPTQGPEPKTLSDVLGNVVARFGLDRSLDDYRIWKAWDDVVGPTIARNAQPQKLSGKRLVVVVKNAGWMQELSMLRRDLTDRMNQWMGREVIREIFLVVGRVDPEETERTRRIVERTIAPAPERGRTDKVTREEFDAAIARLWTAAEEREREDENKKR